MPYHKDKQQAFQAAEQGAKQLQNAYNNLEKDSAGYGQQLKHLRQEVNETYQQIENALEVASETQRAQLEKFRNDLHQIVNEVNEI